MAFGACTILLRPSHSGNDAVYVTSYYLDNIIAQFQTYARSHSPAGTILVYSHNFLRPDFGCIRRPLAQLGLDNTVQSVAAFMKINSTCYFSTTPLLDVAFFAMDDSPIGHHPTAPKMVYGSFYAKSLKETSCRVEFEYVVLSR